jgi:sortase A
VKAAFGWLLVIIGLSMAAIGALRVQEALWAQESSYDFHQPTTQRVFVPDGFVARLSIPRLDVSLYLVDAKTTRDLRRGPGFIVGSTRPGGDNCIIAGHRDTHFRILKDIKLGDQIEIESPSGHFTYRVASFEIVSPTEVQALGAVYPRQLTLVTCYPFYYLGAAPKRFIVRAILQ